MTSGRHASVRSPATEVQIVAQVLVRIPPGIGRGPRPPECSTLRNKRTRLEFKCFTSKVSYAKYGTQTGEEPSIILPSLTFYFAEISDIVIVHLWLAALLWTRLMVTSLSLTERLSVKRLGNYIMKIKKRLAWAEKR